MGEKMGGGERRESRSKCFSKKSGVFGRREVTWEKGGGEEGLLCRFEPRKIDAVDEGERKEKKRKLS